VKNNNQLATGASKASSGWQESVNNHMTMMVGDDKQQERAMDYFPGCTYLPMENLGSKNK
jgi:hypothetical protein